MASTVGKLPELGPDSGSFYVITECFELCIMANEGADYKKLHLVLRAIGEKVQVTL